MARRRAALDVPDGAVIAGIIARERHWAARRRRIEGDADPAEAADAREAELAARWASGGPYECAGWQLDPRPPGIGPHDRVAVRADGSVTAR